MESSNSASPPGISTPLELGGVEVRNRIAFAACVNNLGKNTEITESQVNFYSRPASGGVGIVITEGLSVHPTSIPNATTPLAFDRTLIPGLSRIARAVHSKGARLVGQLWHVGRNSLWGAGAVAWAPSALPDPFSGAAPHQMSEEEIWSLVEGFATTAKNVRDAGFDGVEIHGAHGYLITQFLSAWSNDRQDDWGGSLENRVRFLSEILRAIRRYCDPPFIIGLKLSVSEGVPGGLNPDTTRAILGLLDREGGVDYVAVSQGNFSPSLERHVPDSHFPIGPAVDLCQSLRLGEGKGHKLMALGRIPTLEYCQELVANEKADLVGLVRPLLADPDLLRNWVNGRQHRPCTYCNVCWDTIQRSRPISCAYNPDLHRSDPYHPRIRPAGGDAQVNIIGAGPAGLELARVLANSGVDVQIHEARSRPGGRLLWEGTLPGMKERLDAALWLATAATQAGARLITDEVVSPLTIASWDSDCLVVQASGAEPLATGIDGHPPALSLESALTVSETLTSPVWIIDEIFDEPVYAAAELLSSYGLSVHILTRRSELAPNAPYVNQLGVYRRLETLGVEYITGCIPAGVQDGTLLIESVYSGFKRLGGAVGSIVLAGPYVSRPTLEAGEHPSVVIGDAYARRSVGDIIHEANYLAAVVVDAVQHNRTTGAELSRAVLGARISR